MESREVAEEEGEEQVPDFGWKKSLGMDRLETLNGSSVAVSPACTASSQSSGSVGSTLSLLNNETELMLRFACSSENCERKNMIELLLDLVWIVIFPRWLAISDSG
jgi:hypothetical protein